MHGFGDNIFQKAFVSKLVEDTKEDVYINTSVPQFYTDIPKLKFLYKDVAWRTQRKQKIEGIEYSSPPRKGYSRIIDPHYGPDEIETGSIIQSMENKFKVPFEGDRMTLPDDLPNHGLDLPKNKKIALIRPVTIRNEWPVPARAPDPNYIAWCTRHLKNSGYHTIAIADTQENEEYAIAPLPPTNESYWRGELSMLQTLSLMRDSDITIGGSGWIVPAAVALRTPLFILFGGRGMFDAPGKLFDPRMDLRKIGWSLPDNFCRCNKDDHNCNKKISNLDSDLYKFLITIQGSQNVK